MSLSSLFKELPGFAVLRPQRLRERIVEIPDHEYQQWLYRNNGAIALSGAVRFFAAVPASSLADVAAWNSIETWKISYGRLAPIDLVLFCEDAFGVQFGFDPRGELVRFWNETGEREALGLTVRQFLAAIRDDPEGTVSFELYSHALRDLGPLQLDQHLAFKVETALGGELAISNLEVMDARTHMRASGKIATQISGLRLGTTLEPRRE